MSWKKLTVGIGVAGTLAVGGIDAATLNEEPIALERLHVAGEHVTLEQKGNVVEAHMPWKGEQGLKIKYDLGEPSLAEQIADKRTKSVIAEKVPFQGSEGFKIDILLEEKPNTTEFCYFIEGWENYNFEYQPALTEEEIAQGIRRPDDIVGSYAIYHKELASRRIGAINYETGKFGHIPFPYVWEIGNEANKVRAEDLTFNAGNLCVKAPQDFLDKANYENGVRIDPTFGITAIGGTSLGSNGALARHSRYTLSENGDATEVAWYMNSTDGANVSAAAAIYSDSSGTINALQISSGTRSVDTVAGWEIFSITSTALTAGDWWFGLLVGTNGSIDDFTIYYDSVTATSCVNTAESVVTGFDATPDACTVDTTRQYSTYATYTAAAAADGPTYNGTVIFE